MLIQNDNHRVLILRASTQSWIWKCKCGESREYRQRGTAERSANTHLAESIATETVLAHGFMIGRLYWDEDHPSPWVYFRNVTDFGRWARDVRAARPGTKVETATCNTIQNAHSLLAHARERRTEKKAGKREMPNSLNDRRTYLERQRERIERELQMLESLPEEPVSDDPDYPDVIAFTKTFGRATAYEYAAVRANNGLWYTTGPRSPKGYTWDQLIEWIQDEEPSPVQIWYADHYEEL